MWNDIASCITSPPTGLTFWQYYTHRKIFCGRTELAPPRVDWRADEESADVFEGHRRQAVLHDVVGAGAADDPFFEAGGMHERDRGRALARVRDNAERAGRLEFLADAFGELARRAFEV